MNQYELGNRLRGWFSGKFPDDETAREELSTKFNDSFSSRLGRQVELKKVIRIGNTVGGNETEYDRKIREDLEKLNSKD